MKKFTSMRVLLIICFCVLKQTITVAQDTLNIVFEEPDEHIDPIDATTVPIDGYKSLQRKLETTLNEGDTIGKKYSIRLDNIGFIVRKTGTIDSAWVIYHRRRIHYKIIEQLKTTRWKPVEQDAKPVDSRQELYLDIYLTKAVLKKHGYWPTLGERILAPWID